MSVLYLKLSGDDVYKFFSDTIASLFPEFSKKIKLEEKGEK